MNLSHRFIALSTLLLGLSCTAQADYNQGLKAYQQHNYPTAFMQWSADAVQGNKDAQYKLGLINHYGLGKAVDLDKAYYWYEKAAEQGHTFALSRMGNAYLAGVQEGEDEDKAMQYLAQAAKQGNSEAMLIMAECLQDGCSNLQANPKEAITWVEKALAQPLLGVGLSSDPDLVYYSKTPEKTAQDNEQTLKASLHYRLGVLKFNEQNETDARIALQNLKQADELGQPRAAYYIAALYSGVEKSLSDGKQSKIWLEKSVDPQAKEMLNVLNKYNANNFDELLQQLQNSTDAKDHLLAAHLYEIGMGTYANSSKFEEQMKDAASLGNIEALNYVLGLKNLSIDEHNVWVQKAADAGIATAQLQWGIALIKSNKNEQGLAYLQKAAQQKNAAAKQLLIDLKQNSSKKINEKTDTYSLNPSKLATSLTHSDKQKVDEKTKIKDNIPEKMANKSSNKASTRAF